jgi:hypothetical protein
MRITILFISLLLPVLVCTQVNLDVEGHARIRGNIYLNHHEDSTSLYLGTNAAINTFLNTYRNNTIVGVHSLFNTNSGGNLGVNNSFFGYDAGRNNSGSSNSFFGIMTGTLNKGFANSFFGYNAGSSNDFGGSNAFFGYRAGVNNDDGSSNSFFGQQAGSGNSDGGLNVFIGANAGSKNFNGSHNTFVGAQADQMSNTDSLDKAIALGYNAKAECSNCAVIGGTGTDAVKVAVGVTSPDATLHLHEVNNTRLKLSNENSKEIFIDLIRNDENQTDYDWRIQNSVAGNFEIAYHKTDLEHNSATTLISANPTHFSPASNGNIDLGQSSNQWEMIWAETAEFSELIRLKPLTKAPGCSKTAEGSIYYDETVHKLMVCMRNQVSQCALMVADPEKQTND